MGKSSEHEVGGHGVGRVAVAQLLVAALLLIGIWVALPARYAWVDGAGSGLAGLYAVSGVGLLLRRRWARALALFASWLALALGAAAVTALAFSIAHLVGQYGPVGQGGAMLMGTIAALIVPYLVGLPVLQLAWLRRAFVRRD